MAVGGRRPNELKAGAALSYLVIAAQFVVALAYTPVMLRLLGQTEYGLYSLVASVVGYLSLLSLGFSGAYMRFYSRVHVVEDWAGIRRLNGMFLIVFTTMGLIATAGGALLALNAGTVLGTEFSASELQTARILFVILTLNLAITFPSSVFDAYVVAHERFVFQKSLHLVKTILTPLAVLPALLLGYQAVGMVLATTIVNVAITTYSVAFALKRLGMQFTFRRLNFSLFGEVAVFSSYLFMNMVIDQINWSVDQFIVGRFHGAIPVAVYGVAAMLNKQYLTFSTAISSVFVPRVNTMVASGADDRALSDLFTRVGRVQFLVLGLVISGYVFFGMPFVELWAGNGYRDSYYIGLLLMVPVTLPLLQNLGIEIQKAKNLHQFRSWVYLGVAVGNVALSIPLAQRFEGIGAAAATATSLIIGNVIIMNWHYQARVGLDIKEFWRQVLGVSLGLLPAIGVGTMVVLFVDLSHVGALIGCIVAYVVVYVIGMWKLGMNEYERQLFGAPIMRTLKRRAGR